MFEACVKMRLGAQAANILEVRVVHVRIHSEEALEDDLHHVQKVGRERHTVLVWEDVWVIQLHKRRNNVS